MKTTAFELDGQTWHLCLNGAALFELYDRNGTDGSLLDPIHQEGKAGFDATCHMLAVLAQQGELVRRYQGMDRGGMATEHMFRATLMPLDVLRAKRALEAAVRQGFEREHKAEDEKIDLGLLELQKKTGLG